MTDAIVTVDELARFLGVTDRTVRELNKRGHVLKAGRGAYDLAGSVRLYCEHLRQMASGRGGESSVNELSSQRARLAREQADLASVKNSLLRGSLIEVAAVEREWSGILRTVRAGMLAVPSRVQQRLAHLTAADALAIDREIRDVLTEVGNDGVR